MRDMTVESTHTCLNACKVEWTYDDKTVTSYCLVEGVNYAVAALNLVEEFGEENIVSMTIYPLAFGAYNISESLYKAMRKYTDLEDVDVCDSCGHAE